MPRAGRSLSRRSDAQVFPLELFFDLVFVFAITQCTAIMASDQSWAGLGRGLLVLAVLWWAWTAYAWLTSAIDPEQDATRLTMFAAMGAMLVVSLCVPQAFGDLAVLFVVAYATLRAIQIVLFVLASPDDAGLRRSVTVLAASTAVAVGLLAAAAFAAPPLREVLWVAAVLSDLGGPFLFGSAGWRLVPGHFAERHAAVVIIALGESIVAIGIGASSGGVTTPVVLAALLGVFLSAALWWLHFDVVAIATQRRLSTMDPGREQNELARDAYSYIHLLLVAGIVLLALGTRTSLTDIDAPLHIQAAAALAGGVAAFLWGHVAFRWRFVGTINRERLATGALLVALVPAAPSVPAWMSMVVVTAVTWALVTYETTAWSDTRTLIRRDHGMPDNGTLLPPSEEPPG